MTQSQFYELEVVSPKATTGNDLIISNIDDIELDSEVVSDDDPLLEINKEDQKDIAEDEIGLDDNILLLMMMKFQMKTLRDLTFQMKMTNVEIMKMIRIKTLLSTSWERHWQCRGQVEPLAPPKLGV